MKGDAVLMLELKHIVKTYDLGEERVEALRDVSLSFREHEFVSILGPSGCGKTTLLNIIGGLDQYTSGDLVIAGRSTKDYKEVDWNAYRNHSIGFVFQNYNLIPHQTVLENVELALTLSGVSKGERRKRAIEALRQVGLGDQLKKKPNQMSGGQMQRVAIARALVNDPEILLADEPTGALDSETSVQIMEILKEISKDKLIIMVTHNPDLANSYSTRIIRLLDGRVVDDSMPYDGAQAPSVPAKRSGKTSMSFLTALSLSFKNLLTKKTRTFLTSFAGSIGIIGIALILSVSSGVQSYIDAVQRDTLSSYPITLQAETVDMSTLITSISGAHEEASGEAQHDLDAVYPSSVMYELMNSMNSMESEKNNLAAFKTYLESQTDDLSYISSIQYGYDLTKNIYVRDTDGKIVRSDAQSLMMDMMSALYNMDVSAYMKQFSAYTSAYDLWDEMLPGTNGDLISDLVKEQYDLVYGEWPTKANQVVLVLNKNNEVSDMVLYSLGLVTQERMVEIMRTASEGGVIDTDSLGHWSYEEICNQQCKLFLSSELYQKQENGTYTDLSATEAGLDYLFENAGMDIEISAIVRPNSDAVATSMSGSIGYTTALTRYLIEGAQESDVVRAQLADPSTDVLTGLPFKTDESQELTAGQKAERVKAYIAGLSPAEKASLYISLLSTPTQEYLDQATDAALASTDRETLIQSMVKGLSQQMGVDESQVQSYIGQMDADTQQKYAREMISAQIAQQYAQQVTTQLGAMSTDQLAALMDAQALTDAQVDSLFEEYLPAAYSDSTYEDNLKKLGVQDENSPSTINLFAATFEDKDKIADLISRYNEQAAEADQISYTDYVALLMSSITTIINAISYVLIAFVAISLVVSSIMIGIITYISVLERTKEIGILRAIGASRRDVSHVFNAETLLVGFVSGALGIGITLLLNQVINLILHHLTGIGALNAILPPAGAVILVLISMLLTFIAGLIPSGVAARKDPVVALRTE